MDYLEHHPWRQSLVNAIANDIGADIADENPDWEYLDGEMVKLGSLEHELLNIETVQKIVWIPTSPDKTIITYLSFSNKRS